ncbi:MAG: OsmC family protein [Christensenellaceae bacterium]
MDTLTVKLQSLDDKAMFSTTARDNPQIIVDYFPPVGTGKGYTSLELLMASFGSCVSTTLLTLLRHKMQKTVDGIAVQVIGEVRENHPKALEKMNVTLDIRATDLTEPEVRQTLKAANAVCPVWAMLKGNVEIDIAVKIAQ